jgi:catechol 2,3-dioxygenase-like lactoylglutathione lyase family enzyme
VEVLASRVLLRPVDLSRSEAFYGEALGLAVYREYGTGDHRGVVYFLGGGFLELAGRAPTPAGPKVMLWLQVRDLGACHRELTAAGVEILDPPARRPWGLDEMWIADPDGLRIAVIEVPPEHPLRRRPE